MTEKLTAIDEEQAERERTRQLLGEFKPRSSWGHDERIRLEDVDIIVERIKGDESLTNEERQALLSELAARHDRAAILSPHSHMGD